MPKSVYVAGASTERKWRAKPVMAALRAMGFHITHDWTDSVDMNTEGAECKIVASEAQLKKCAKDDVRGVVDADFLVLLAPQGAYTTTGAWAELGIALQARKPCLVVGGENCIFTYEDGVTRFASDTDVLKHMEKISST